MGKKKCNIVLSNSVVMQNYTIIFLQYYINFSMNTEKRKRKRG